MWTHARTYKGLGFDKIVHRNRLRKLLNIIKSLELNGTGRWADVGCSDGYILERLRSEFCLNRWELFGLDHSEGLLSAARDRNIPHSTFVKYDLNNSDIMFRYRFDVVSCFETLEHIGNYKSAFEIIFLITKNGGHMLISMPNECGLQGIIKFVGRALLRRNVYTAFCGRSKLNKWNYFLALIRGKEIESFRNPKVKNFSTHLGFNYKNLERFIIENYINKKTLEIIKRESSFFGFNKIYLFRKR